MPVPLGQPGLDHEVLDDAMELQAVVKALGGKFLKIGDRLRRLVGMQGGADGALLVSIVAIFMLFSLLGVTNSGFHE